MDNETINGLLRAIDAMNRGDVATASLLAAELPLRDRWIVSNADYNQLLGAMDQSQGKTHTAIHHLKAAYGCAPRRTDISQRLGQLLLASGDLKEAAYYLGKAHRFAHYEGREEVFVVGDSHADFCFSGIPRCKVHWLGPMTMHRVGRDGLSAVNLKTLQVPERAAAVFVFGEIDIRVHVSGQISAQGRDRAEVLATLCQSYIAAICQSRDQYAGLRVMVASVVPPMVGENNPEVPFRCPLEERVANTRDVNALLRALCATHGLQFLDTYPYFAEPSGVMVRAISDNLCHVRREFSDIVELELDKALALPL